MTQYRAETFMARGANFRLKKYDSIKSALLNIAEWFKEERPLMDSMKP